MAIIYIPTIMRRITDGQAEIATSGETLEQAFSELEGRFPGLNAKLRSETGAPLRHIRIFVNNDDVTLLGPQSIALRIADEVMIIPAMAGG